MGTFALTLVLTVLCKYLLLLPDKLTGRNKVFRYVRPERLLFCVLRFLVRNLSYGVALFVKRFFMTFPLCQLVADTDDL